jgi:hypothetical protein
LLDASAYQLGWLNPGVTATYGLLGSALVALPFTLRRRTVAPQAAGAAL